MRLISSLVLSVSLVFGAGAAQAELAAANERRNGTRRWLPILKRIVHFRRKRNRIVSCGPFRR